MSKGATMEAIERLYRTRYVDFLRTASALANDREAGRDAVHDAFVAAVRSRRRYRSEGTLEAWVWPMVVRNARKRRISSELPTNGNLAEPIWTDADRDEAAPIRAAVARLPDRQRLVLFLRYYGGLEYEEIAQVVGVRPGTVAAQLHSAHEFLRHRLEEVRV
jgi:RNA polymerase sigma-70 factor, ECF subfamily